MNSKNFCVRKAGFKVSAVIALALAAVNAFAGTTGSGKITSIYFISSGNLLITIDAAHANPPACATIQSRFALNATTLGGKVQATGLLTAFAAGKSVTFWGASQCNVWGDTETVDFFLVAN